MKKSIVFFMIVRLILSKKFSYDKEHAKIVGGWPVDLKKFPHAARFYNGEAMCAGVILSSWSLLTSAHCFDHNDDVSHMAVVVGSQSLTDYKGQWASVVKAVVHENYNTSVQFACDVAVVFLNKKIWLSSTVQRVIIAHNNAWMRHKEGGFEVSGWGFTSFRGTISPQLLMTKLHYIDRAKCEQLNGIKLSPDIFCLYGDGKSDACKGDSGGGVMWKGMLVGLTSHGNGGCAQINKPTMFANVWYLRDWIEKQVRLFVRDCASSEYLTSKRCLHEEVNTNEFTNIKNISDVTRKYLPQLIGHGSASTMTSIAKRRALT